MKYERAAVIALVLMSTIGFALAGGPSSTTSTTTTLPPVCADAETFESTHCRLQELAGMIATTPALGALAAKLDHAIDFAERNVQLGDEQCDLGDTKRGQKRLKKAIRRLIQYGHRLRSLKTRNTYPPEVLAPFVDAGRAIQQDLEALRKGLACPPASPNGAFVS
jgi:hypothetical protein